MQLDADLLVSLEEKLQLVRDRTQGVATGYANGFYIWGDGGIGKSHTVLETLEALKKSWKLTNSRLTGRGLFNLLRDYPHAVHVIEDVESMFGDKTTAGVMRSALWGQVNKQTGRQDRLVVWETFKERDEFYFCGGVILTANKPISDIPELRALKTRIADLHFTPSTEEVEAKMRDIARSGFRHQDSYLEPEHCLEVAEVVIEKSKQRGRLDLRLLINSFADRLQWANGDAVTHWLDMLESRIKSMVSNQQAWEANCQEGGGTRSGQKHHALASCREGRRLGRSNRQERAGPVQANGRT